MDEIWFRGRTLRGEWVYGDLVHKFDMSYIVCYDPEIRRYEYIEVEPGTVGQYIGLVDKNETRMFTGDVLRFPPHNDPNIAFIVYENGGYGIKDAAGRIFHHIWDFPTAWEREVISNIHDHPNMFCS